MQARHDFYARGGKISLQYVIFAVFPSIAATEQYLF
jgi:hypothetical protein